VNDHLVTCRTLDDGGQSTIRGLGGQRTWWSSQDIMRCIEEGAATFWVSVKGRRVDVIIRDDGEFKSIATKADEQACAILLRLPEC
jgi:hypothetical protein